MLGHQAVQKDRKTKRSAICLSTTSEQVGRLASHRERSATSRVPSEQAPDAKEDGTAPIRRNSQREEVA